MEPTADSKTMKVSLEKLQLAPFGQFLLFFLPFATESRTETTTRQNPACGEPTPNYCLPTLRSGSATPATAAPIIVPPLSHHHPYHPNSAALPSQNLH